MTSSRPFVGHVKAMLVDDSDHFRAALREVLELDGRFEVVGEAVDGEDLTAHLDRLAHSDEGGWPDLVVLDVHMPAGGAEAVRRARAPRPGAGAVPEPAVAAVSARLDTRVVAELIAAGATAVLSKSRRTEALADQLHRCAEGEVLVGVPQGRRALAQALRLADDPA